MKRQAQVPPAVAALDGIASKATLLEVCYWFAVRLVGEENESAVAIEIVKEIETLTGEKVRVPMKWTGSHATALRDAIAMAGSEARS